MRPTPSRNPKSHRRAAATVALATLLALAAAALAPAGASAADDQGTGTGSRCIQAIPSVYIDLATGASCDPTEGAGSGEIIEIHRPYMPPACSLRDRRCGLSDEGRAPQPRGSDGKSFGPGPGKGRGPGAAKPGPKSAPKPTPKPNSEDDLTADRCRWLRDAAEIYMPHYLSTDGKIADVEDQIWVQEENIYWHVARFLTDTFRWHNNEISAARATIQGLGQKLALLRSQAARVRKARADWKALGCQELLFP